MKAIVSREKLIWVNMYERMIELRPRHKTHLLVDEEDRPRVHRNLVFE